MKGTADQGDSTPVETAAIAYRVADFLKRHAPFHAVAEADLLALAAGGRVRFHEPNEYLLWQGEPHRRHVFVIQQGTVSLWDESGEAAKLRDVRGAGDMLGLERYNDARACLYSARSGSDVVIYAFDAGDFETHVLKYPHAVQYVSAEGRVTPDYQPTGERKTPTQVFLHDLAAHGALPTCHTTDSIATAASRLQTSGSGAVVVVDAEERPHAVLTAASILQWVAAGGGSTAAAVDTLMSHPPTTVSPDASAADGLLAMAGGAVDVVAITVDGTPNGRVQALVTRDHLAPLFGDNPAALLRELRTAGSTAALRELNQRARTFILDHLAGAPAVEWLARFAHGVDSAILARVLHLTGVADLPVAWCFAGSAGRAESLTALAPLLVAVIDDGIADETGRLPFPEVLDALLDCGYLPRLELPYELPFYAAGVREWQDRYRNWVSDSVRQQTFRTRTLFDVRPIAGPAELWEDVRVTVAGHIDRDFVHLLANDCFATLPPLTFFQDAVVDSFGEHTTTFRLEHSCVRPLVDVGRVFALAAGEVQGRSTLERFDAARHLLPAHDAVIREAADTLRIVLWQQGRVGIAEGTSGAELPAALLGRHDRQVLKRGFRSILHLLELTANLKWLDEL
jgi:CBS domain-containing protein